MFKFKKSILALLSLSVLNVVGINNVSARSDLPPIVVNPVRNDLPPIVVNPVRSDLPPIVVNPVRSDLPPIVVRQVQ